MHPLIYLTACVAGAQSPMESAAVPAAEKAFSQGIVYVVEGIGGYDPTGANLASALKRAEASHRVERFVWTHGPGRYLRDLQDIEHVKQKAKELANVLKKRHEADPEAPIFVIGRSGGTGLVLMALEELPERTVDRVVLLSPAVTPNYDLGPALKAVKREIVSFNSRMDWMQLNLGTRIFGTIDRNYSYSAGLSGFEPPTEQDDQLRAAYRRVVQIHWRPRDIFDGHPGLHIGTRLTGFLTAQVVPWLK